MDLLTAIHVMRRRWPVLTIGLVVACGAVLALGMTMKPTYSVTSTVLLLPPRAGGVHQQSPANDSKSPPPKLVNPYLSFDSTLNVLARIVVEDVTTDDFRGHLQVGGSRYEVSIKPDAPMIAVMATGHDEHETLATRDNVVSAVTDDVVNRQRAAGVPEDTWVTVTLVSQPQTADQTTDKLKVVAAVAALGVVAAVGLAFVAESLTTRGHRRLEDALTEADLTVQDNFGYGGERRSRQGQPGTESRGLEGLPKRTIPE